MSVEPQSSTPNLNLPYLLAAQAQKHVTHNEALRHLDALVQLTVADRDRATPPADPDNGDRHIVATGASNVWAGHDHQVAAFQDGAWTFYAPADGWRAWVEADAALLVWSAGGWVGLTGSAETVDRFGVNTAADGTNRLSVKADATLLSHDDVTPGSGDHRLVVNKLDMADTASLVFQTGYSARAEFGLSGDDDWSVKVSADGTNWYQAMSVDKASGAVTFAEGLAVSQALVCTNPNETEFPMRSDLPAGLSQSQGTMTFGYPGYGGVLTLNITANRCFQWIMDGTSGRFYTRVNHVSQPDASNDWSDWRALWGEAHQGAGSGMTTDKVPVSSMTGLTPTNAASSGAGAVRMVSNATGGAALVFSDGSNWLRASDGTTVS